MQKANGIDAAVHLQNPHSARSGGRASSFSIFSTPSSTPPATSWDRRVAASSAIQFKTGTSWRPGPVSVSQSAEKPSGCVIWIRVEPDLALRVPRTRTPSLSLRHSGAKGAANGTLPPTTSGQVSQQRREHRGARPLAMVREEQVRESDPRDMRPASPRPDLPIAASSVVRWGAIATRGDFCNGS